jgi:hypothetical protein
LKAGDLVKVPFAYSNHGTAFEYIMRPEDNIPRLVKAIRALKRYSEEQLRNAMVETNDTLQSNAEPAIGATIAVPRMKN